MRRTRKNNSVCSYAPLNEEEKALLGWGGQILLDNANIGRVAADFFLKQGMTNFAFVGCDFFRETFAVRDRETAFHDRIRGAMLMHMEKAKKQGE